MAIKNVVARGMIMPILLAVTLASCKGTDTSLPQNSSQNVTPNTTQYVIQTPTPVATPTPVDTPTSDTKIPALAFALMDPSDDSDQFNTYLSMEKIDGIALRLSWSNIQPTSESGYDWSKIDNAFAMAQSLNKKVTLHILSSVYGNTPSWVFAAGAESFTYDKFGSTKTDPLPWDSVYLSKWENFLTALSDHITALNYLSQLEYISVGAPVPEMSIGSCYNGDLNGSYSGSTSYDRNAYLSAWKASVLATHNAFPSTKKLLPAPFIDICFTDKDGGNFYKEVFDYAKTLSASLFSHYATDLKATGSQRLDQISSILNEAPVALQYIWSYTDDKGTKLEGTFRTATCNGIQNLNGVYFEVYKSDLTNPDTNIQSAVQVIHEPGLCQ